ncbi:chaplin family protein [Actinomadura macra]|uniref:chaplin family protein n=1 Tax=Actinomadura macra TaxID=46164 RepID=UPI000B226C63|nr:chaplin family protein [Actinomadura macra]
MRIWSKNTSRAALVAAASVTLGAGGLAGLAPAASADGGMQTSGNFSILGGNQVYAPISIPVEVSGNAIAVLGLAQASSHGGASVKNHRHGGGGGGGGGGMKTSGMFSIGGGNQIYLPISVPIDICGNAVAVLGLAKAQCKGGASVVNDGHHGGHHGGWRESGTGTGAANGYRGSRATGDQRTATGDQRATVGAPRGSGAASHQRGAGVPSDQRGSGIAGVQPGAGFPSDQPSSGFTSDQPGSGLADDQRGSGIVGDKRESAARGGDGWGGDHGGGGGMQTSGNFSILGGNQIYAPISAPINVCGNSVAVLGIANSWCKGGAHVSNKRGGGDGMQTSGNFSILGGNQIYAPISAPINVCGNAVAVLGVSQAWCKGGATVTNGGDKPLPPTLRTPPKVKKPHKPRKNRPGAGHHKLPSTKRVAAPRPAAQPGRPSILRDLMRSTPVKAPGLVQTSLQKESPVTLGTPLLGG